MSAKSPSLFDQVIAANRDLPLVHEQWKHAAIDLGNGMTLVPDAERGAYFLNGHDWPGRSDYAQQEAKREFNIHLTLYKDNEGHLGSASLKHVQQALARKLGFQPRP